jgi:hypothetical protein
MPSADAVLMWATMVANDWRWLAIAWHGALAVPILMIVLGWRPSVRPLGSLLVAPLISVSGLAWLSGNPFNGLMFAVLAAVLAAAMIRYAKSDANIAAPVSVVFGAAFAVLGWIYPHFVTVESWATYIYASPLGLLPCPTLLFVIGVTLMFLNLDAVRWRAPLAVAGLLYGAIGVFRLGVALDWALLVASAMLTAKLARTVPHQAPMFSVHQRDGI